MTADDNAMKITVYTVNGKETTHKTGSLPEPKHLVVTQK
jgi:hypothetical protein